MTTEGGMTSTEGGRTDGYYIKEVKNTGDAKKDSIWTGRGAKIVAEYADTVKGELIVKGDTDMVVREIRVPDYKKKK
jgi:hypothetical protein